MNIRLMKPEEHVIYAGMCQNVFWTIEPEDMYESFEAPLEHAKDDDNVRLGAYEGDKLVSALQVIPYNMRMNGKTVKMGGVGGVVTLPEYRGQGHVKQIMHEAFNSMKERGQVFSFLYPFSYEYYRKLGYEICLNYHSAGIPLGQFRAYPFPDDIRPHKPNDSHAPFVKIYNSFIEGRNLAIIRDDKAWERHLDRDAYKDRKFTYILYQNNEPCAYILYDLEREEFRNKLIIQELCWISHKALHGVFGFLYKLSAEFHTAYWNSPTDIAPYSLLPDIYDIAYDFAPSGMMRIMDEMAALQTLNAPKGRGGVNISVHDEFYQSKNDYAISWEDSKLQISKTTGKTEAELSIKALAQLICGYVSVEEALYRQDVTINGAFEAMHELFPKRGQYIIERF